MAAPMRRPERWWLLACPECRIPLPDRGERLQCSVCSATFACRRDIDDFPGVDIVAAAGRDAIELALKN